MDLLQLGIGEFFVSFVAVALGLAFPVGILFLLYKIYLRLKHIDEQLKEK